MAVLLPPDGTVQLAGDCPLEEAERLLQALVSRPAAIVDWRQCTGAHSALIQVLVSAKPALRGPPASDVLRIFIEPALASEGRTTDPGGARG